ncbi:PadR family transcriptional regulator [Paenibacillus sedimenti]|uniref:PadR family transcriptional regulator n=1 Tax=Paenibacillus sedimenti TaxID=2770274 RepID=A0A926QJ89_9BACL|nr:PadR family transcriptional regulator [Paenibacillus sedimenti]MBD0381310.1 PadR family transcriptional regulator [Paenibacillus sedimenti]
MEFVILGLLLIRNLTQYDIKNVLQQKVSPFFSASLGSIQAALKKLESNGHVELTEVVESGRRKKIYAINNLGRQYFMDWMLSSIAPNRLEQDVTTRLFFLGFMPQPKRVELVKAVVTHLESTVHEFEASFTEATQKEVPEHLKQVVKYQLKTLDLGLFYHRSMLEWFNELLTELEGSPHEQRNE